MLQREKNLNAKDISTIIHSHTCRHAWMIEYTFNSLPLKTYHFEFCTNLLKLASHTHTKCFTSISHLSFFHSSFTNILALIYTNFNLETHPRSATHHLHFQFQIRSTPKHSIVELEWGWPKHTLNKDLNKSQHASTCFHKFHK